MRGSRGRRRSIQARCPAAFDPVEPAPHHRDAPTPGLEAVDGADAGTAPVGEEAGDVDGAALASVGWQIARIGVLIAQIAW